MLSQLRVLTSVRSAGALTALLVAGACGSDAAPSDDGGSAGHTVISNADRKSVPEWRLASPPTTDIGSGDTQALVMVTAGLVAGEQIIVADAGTASVRYFDRAGRHLRDAGVRGSGPGQFQHLGWMGLLPADSVAVWDPVLRRLSVFDKDGRFARMTTLHFARGPLPAVRGAFGDGSFLLTQSLPSARVPAPGTAWRDTLLYLRVMPDGSTADTLGRFPGAEWYAAAGEDGAPGRVHSLPFGRQAAADARGDMFYVGMGDGYQVARYGSDGTERLRMRKPHRPMALTRDDITEFQATLIQVGGTEEERRERMRELQAAPYPSTLPPYTSLTLDALGNVWVREPHTPGKLYESSHWSIFDSHGRWIATARGPGRFKVLQIGPDWVLGTETDRDDVDHVRLYALNRG
jgi:hypothetical protein